MAGRRPRPDCVAEVAAGYPARSVAGVDEVGRGCLAGPVVAGAIVLPASVDRTAFPWIDWIHDSKLLSAERREELAPLILGWAEAGAIGSASVEEIDRLNIHAASHLAMQRALAALKTGVSHVLVDGKFVPKELPCPGTAIVKGDQKSLSIAAASIIAKVHRDRLMSGLESLYPGYGFVRHKGYSTPEHAGALYRLGPCPEHRRSFAPVRRAMASAESGSEPRTLPLFEPLD